MKMIKGFTIAETVVTLGIIGILASITLPAIRHLKPNTEMLMLKKVYYNVSRMVNELINDDDFYPDADTEEGSGFSNVNSVPPAVYHGVEYKGVTKFCGLFAARMNVKSAINCSETSPVTSASTFPTAGAAPSGTGTFTTADGVVWVLPIGSFASTAADPSGKMSIYVDVNGDKPGNCFENANCKIPDRFEIQVDRWGRIYVNSPLAKKYLSNTDVTKSYEDFN